MIPCITRLRKLTTYRAGKLNNYGIIISSDQLANHIIASTSRIGKARHAARHQCLCWAASWVVVTDWLCKGESRPSRLSSKQPFIPHAIKSTCNNVVIPIQEQEGNPNTARFKSRRAIPTREANKCRGQSADKFLAAVVWQLFHIQYEIYFPASRVRTYRY